VDAFLDRVPGPNYKCFDFAREVWRESFGIDVGDQLKTLSGALSDRRVVPSEMKGFAKLSEPVDPCFVVFQRARTTPHIGVWHAGRVLHLQGGASAQFSRLEDIARRYTKVSFYK
jgi:hypothetical protein